MAFRFKLKERVTVPGTNGVQAIIVEHTESVPGFPVYQLSWTNDDCGPSHGVIGETDLLACNTPALGKPKLASWRVRVRKAARKIKR